MLAYRSSDGLIAAATHGRGVWTQPYYSVVPTNKFLLKGKWEGKNEAALSWDYDALNPAISMDIESSTDGLHFSKVGSVAYSGDHYAFNISTNLSTIFYRIKSNEITGNSRFSNSIRLVKNSSGTPLALQLIYPDPVEQTLGAAFSVSSSGKVNYFISNLAGQYVWKKEENISYSGAFNRTWNIDLKPGVYLFSIVAGNERKTQKFLKQ
jgi:hypothetical protein